MSEQVTILRGNFTD